MTATSAPAAPVYTSPSNGDAKVKTWLSLIQIALAILLPGVGFLAATTMENAKDLAGVKASTITHAELLESIRTHETHPHPGAVTRSEMREDLGEIKVRLAAIEQALREK